MAKTILIIIILIIIIILLLKGCEKNTNKNEEPITFKDPVFEQMITKELNKSKIYPSDLEGYSGILIAADRLMSFSGKGKDSETVILYGFDTFEHNGVRYTEYGTMKSLEDLSNFPNLTRIHIYLQPEIDFGTIPNKKNIYNLCLEQSKINDLTFLEGYSKLLYLSLGSNEIVNLNGIQNLITLKNISFNSNNIVDITLLSNLTNVEELDLTYNKVVDVRPLTNMTKLEYLSLYENGISNIEPLASITSLKELYLNNNNITDISPLEAFTSFDSLNVSGNPIQNIEKVNHIQNVVK